MGGLPDDMSYDGTEVVYFHGTGVSRGLEILYCGAMMASCGTRPFGVYTAKNETATKAYDLGCIVEVISVGRILSVKETASLDDLPVPEGFVGCLKRSVQEFIHHPNTIEIIVLTFDVKSLMDAIQFVAPLPAPFIKRVKMDVFGLTNKAPPATPPPPASAPSQASASSGCSWWPAPPPPPATPETPEALSWLSWFVAETPATPETPETATPPPPQDSSRGSWQEPQQWDWQEWEQWNSWQGREQWNWREQEQWNWQEREQ